MGSPKTNYLASKRSEIVKGAADLFLRHGFSGTSMASIAAAVGGSKATLYNHFPTKELLFEAVIDMVLTQRRSVDDIDYRSMPCRKGLFAIATTIFTAAQESRSINVHRLVFFEARHNKAVGRALIGRGPEHGRQIIQSAFEHYVATGQLVCRDGHKASLYFVSLLFYQHMLYREGGMIKEFTQPQIEKHVDGIIDDFLKICPVL